MTPKELIHRFNDSHLKVKGGVFNVWGLPFGKRGDNFYKLDNIKFDEAEKRLELNTDYVKSKIWNPTGIFDNPAKNEFWPPLLEIKNADRIRLEYTFNEQDFFIDIDFNTKEVKSNSDWYGDEIIKSAGGPALIFG